MSLPPVLDDWFAARGWAPHTHQLAILEAHSEGFVANFLDRRLDRLNRNKISKQGMFGLDVGV